MFNCKYFSNSPLGQPVGESSTSSDPAADLLEHLKVETANRRLLLKKQVFPRQPPSVIQILIYVQTALSHRKIRQITSFKMTADFFK